MTQADLILSSIMDIKGDIGEIKGIQTGLQTQMDDLDKSMEVLERSCKDTTVITVNKKQLILAVGGIITTIGGIGFL